MAEESSKLSEEQIFEFLKTVNVPVRMSDVKNPHKEYIVRVFEYFLRDLQIDINELISWETVSHLEDISIYEEQVFLISLSNIINHITSPLGIDISLKDILDPKPKRTKKILNYLLVFWNYYLVRCARFHAIRDSYEGDRKKAEDIILENKSLDEKYNEMIDILDKMKPSKEELSDIISVKQEKGEKLEKEAKAVHDDYEGLKVKETKLHEEINAIQVDITATEKAIQELEQHILSSPCRINSEVQNLTDKIKAEDQKVKECEIKLKLASKRLQKLEHIMLEDEKDSKFLSELSESINSLIEKVKEMLTYYEKVCEEEEKLKRLQMDLNRKEDSNLQQEQMSAKVALNSKKHLEAVKETFKIYSEQEASLAQEIKHLTAEKNYMQQSIDKVSDNILETIKKLKEADAKNKIRNDLFVSNMEKIKKAFQSDAETIQKAFKMKFGGL